MQILPRIQWPLLVYEFPLSSVEEIERRINSHLRRCEELPRSLSSITLSVSKFEFMVTRAREVLRYRESRNPKVWHRGKDWKEVEGTGGSGPGGISAAAQRAGRICGSTPTTHCDKAKGKERHDLVQREVSAGVEELRASQMVGMQQQAVDHKISWSKMWKAETFLTTRSVEYFK